MRESILSSSRILAVDDEVDVLDMLEEEILEVCPNCIFDRSPTHEEAFEKITSGTYDLVILDIMGVRGFDLLELAASRDLPVVMLTANALNPEALKRSIEMGARAYLPKEKLGEIVPFLEDVLKESDPSYGWGHLITKLEEFFNDRWGEFWKKGEEEFWRELHGKTSHSK